MKTVSLNLRYSLTERVQAFERGLGRLGFKVKPGAQPADVLVTWNRIGGVDRAASTYETVLVAENAAWGNGFMGGRWLSLARNRHNTAGMFPVGGADRWDDLGVELKPWRTEGETVVLPQRGIGSPPTAMPRDWPAKQKGRIRMHPGQNKVKPLEEDLATAGKVVTWASGGAVKALMWGIKVESHYPLWVAKQDNTDSDRLRMLRELAWCQWTIEEIASGMPFERLLYAEKSHA